MEGFTKIISTVLKVEHGEMAWSYCVHPILGEVLLQLVHKNLCNIVHIEGLGKHLTDNFLHDFWGKEWEGHQLLDKCFDLFIAPVLFRKTNFLCFFPDGLCHVELAAPYQGIRPVKLHCISTSSFIVPHEGQRDKVGHNFLKLAHDFTVQSFTATCHEDHGNWKAVPAEKTMKGK